MNANQLQTVSSYFATSPKGVTEEREFTAAQLAYTAHTVDADGNIVLNRATAQRLVESWSAVGAKDGYSYSLPEELYFSAYHVHELGSGTVLRVMTQHGKHHDEPITGWEMILDLTDGKSHYRNRDGRVYDCF